MPGWHRLGAVDPRFLVDARLQSYWAAQLAAAVGRTLLPPRDDDSHTSFRCDRAHQALAQDAVRFPLDGRTLRDAFLWIETQAPGVREEFDDPMPSHRVRSGAQFSLGDGRALAELSRYFANADLVLRELSDDVRCWPHHFDIATLLEFERGFLRSGITSSRSLIGA